MAADKKTPSDFNLPLLTPQLPRLKDRRGRSGEAMNALLKRIQTGAQERRSFRERRATPRAVIALDVEALDGGEAVMLRTHDLSTFGLAVSTGPTPKVGQKLTVRLFLPDEPTVPLVLKVEVLGSFSATGGVRMKFVKPSVEAVKRIHRFVT